MDPTVDGRRHQPEMEDIKDKLREARYFLQQMKATESWDLDQSAAEELKGKDHINDFLKGIVNVMASQLRALRYNMSAFLSAARSVNFMIQKAFGRVRGFREWMREVEGEEIMRRLTEMRDTTVHRRPVRPVDADIDVDISPDERQWTLKWQWVFSEFPDESALSVCEAYLTRLERLVEECDSRFSR